MPEFRSLASILAQREPAPERESQPAPAHVTQTVAATQPPPAPAPPADERVLDMLDSFIGEVARLRARVAECLEEHAEAVLADLARLVLARELACAPPAIESLLRDALAEFDATPAVVVRVSVADAERLGNRWPVEIEPSLRPGDFALETGDGRYDATLQTRLDAVLASHRVAT